MVSTWPRPTRQIVVNWGCIGFVSGIWTARTLGETCIAFLFYVEALSARGRACHEAVSIIRLVTTTETRDFAYLDELPRERTYLLPALHLLHEREGYLSPAGLAAVSQRLRVPHSELYGVARRYSALRFEPPAERRRGARGGAARRRPARRGAARSLPLQPGAGRRAGPPFKPRPRLRRGGDGGEGRRRSRWRAGAASAADPACRPRREIG